MDSDSNFLSPWTFGLLPLLAPGCSCSPWTLWILPTLCAHPSSFIKSLFNIPAEWASASCQDLDWYNFSWEIQNSGIRFQKLAWLRACFEKMFTSLQKPSFRPGCISLCPLEESVVGLQPLNISQAPMPRAGKCVAFRASVPGAIMSLHFGDTDHQGSWKKRQSN